MKFSHNILTSGRQLPATPRALILLVVSYLLVLNPVQAEDNLCLPAPVNLVTESSFSKDGKTHVLADKASVKSEQTSLFEGNVVIQLPATRIESDQAEYQKDTEQVFVRGNVRYLSESLLINSETADFNITREQASLNNNRYQSLEDRMRGAASKIEVSGSDKLELSDATFTTCDPGQTDWLLSADKITLDRQTRQGHAEDVVVRFKGVPFFYFPYMRFPIGDERLSGFLFPDFGNSNQRGTEIKIPYYWNIHPQVDATITPWFMSRRGVLLHTEFRYLLSGSEGKITSEYIDNDKVYNDKRERWHWLHTSVPVNGWYTNADVNYVGDNRHLLDFSDDLNLTTTTHLLQSLSAHHDSENWQLTLRAEKYQTISGDNPYQRLPQLTYNSRYPVIDNHLNYSITSEAVRFRHLDQVTIGDRVHLKPSIFWPLKSAAGFLEPRLSLQYTSYNLEQISGENKLSRTIPTFSLNSGLFFERDTSLFDTPYIQTLEPQLFYVYVPYQDQSDFPVFDTSAYTFNVNQSFTDYRFNGIDRIGDDNRITTTLATRFINHRNGEEVFMARVGQVTYLDDRRVQLPGTATDTSKQSNWITELKAMPGNWQISSQVEWDPDTENTVLSTHSVNYQYQDRFDISLAHRFQKDVLETQELRMNWKVSSRWKLHTNYLYDIKDRHIVENLFGIQYESCCWGLILDTRERYLAPGETDRGFYFSLVLKGLGDFGTN